MRNPFKTVSLSIIICLLLLMTLLIPSPLMAWWWPSGEKICTAYNEQTYPCLVNDGSGGAIIAWADFRDGEYDIYAQRIDGDGHVLWEQNGVIVCDAFSSQNFPRIVTDGAGGAIIVWRDERGGGGVHPYAQRIDENGNIQWTNNGIIACNASNEQCHPEIYSDGFGGVLIVFGHNTGSEIDIYAQLVDETGAVQWGSSGVPISTASGIQQRPKVISDGLGGAIVAWQDDNGVWAQRVDASGTISWSPNGENISADVMSGCGNGPELATDTVHGAIIVWVGSDQHIYAQRVDQHGNATWNSGNRITICSEEWAQTCPKISPDGSGGAVIVWEDLRYLTDHNENAIYSQKIGFGGDTKWTVNGVDVYSEEGTHRWAPEIVSDGVGGAIVVWEDDRNGNYDVYYQRLASSDGAKMCFGQDGAYACNSRNNQTLQKIISDGSNGAVITWRDERRPGNRDIYAMRFNSICETYYADADDIPINFTLSQNVPNPFNPTTMIRFCLPRAMHVKLTIYNVKGELIATVLDAHMTEGSKEVKWDAKDARGRSVESGIYLYRLIADDIVQTRKMVLLK